MAATTSNKLKYLLAKKVIDFANDSFKIILMDSGFTFNVDTHISYSSVSGYELDTEHGYTVNNKLLSGVLVTEDTSNDRCSVTWENVVWTASGGSIGPTSGAIIFDDTVASPTAKPVIGYIDFGGDQTQVDGGVATISSIEIRIA